jgi:hypothetical protein
VWLPLVQVFACDDGLGPSHGNDWLAWPCDDGSLLSPLYQLFGDPPLRPCVPCPTASPVQHSCWHRSPAA